MRAVLRWALALAACLLGSSVAHAQLDQPDALKTYRTIWDQTDDALWEAVFDLRTIAPNWRPDRPSALVFVQRLELVERLADATRLESSPASREPTDQWEQATSDARNFRRTAYILSVDATRLLAEGNADAAAARVGAILRLADQLANQSRIDAATLAVMCIELVDEQVESVCASSSLTERGRRELSVGVASLDAKDPVGFRRAFEGARAFGTWATATCVGDKAGETLVDALPLPEDRKRPLAEGEEPERRRGMRRAPGLPSRQLVSEIRRQDAEGIRSAARQFEKMIEEALEAWDQPDAEEALRGIDFQADRGVYGVFARLLPQFYSRHRRTADRVDDAMGRIGVIVVARKR
jgi:hypothetical protein